jgi:hypothetical protein
MGFIAKMRELWFIFTKTARYFKPMTAEEK